MGVVGSRPRRVHVPRPSWLVAIILTGVLLPALAAAETSGEVDSRKGAIHGVLPLSFVPNRGQLPAGVRYHGRTRGYGIHFAPDEVTFGFAPRSADAPATWWWDVGLRFVGARPDPDIEGREAGITTVNYLVGTDPAAWRTGLPTYREIVYRELWPGIDLVFRLARGQLKYEFVVRPGAAPERIRLAYRGAESLAVDAGGHLLIRTPRGNLSDERPTSYQVIDGRRVAVDSRFVVSDASGLPRYGFALGPEYDPRHLLVIDPGFQAGEYSTLVGGTGSDVASATAVDPSGNAYVVGHTASPDLPAAAGSFAGGSKVRGSLDAFVAKVSPDGFLLFATYLGGSDADVGLGIAVDGSGSPHVTGYTYSRDFPTTVGAFSRKITGNADAFVTKLSADGQSLRYSTFLGGGSFDAGHAIALEPGCLASCAAYVTGETLSSSFPITPFAVFASSQGKRDAFVTKLNAGGTAVVYSTYLGGNGDDIGHAIAVGCPAAEQCSAHVAGQTSSPGLPTRSAAGAPIDPTLSGPTDAFVVKLAPGGSALVYLTYLGGSGADAAHGIALDAGGQAYVTGATTSADFPTTAGAFRRQLGLNGGVATVDAFVTRLNTDGSALGYSTFVGGRGDDTAYGIAVDGTGRAHITGRTTSPDLPTSAGAPFPDYAGGGDAFAAKLAPDGSALLYGTYLGGGRDDAGYGIALECPPTGACVTYVAGSTASLDFPRTLGPGLNLDGSLSDTDADAFVVRLDSRAGTSTGIALSTGSSGAVFGQPVTITATVSAASGTPAGLVTFKDGAVVLGARSLDAGGQASLTTSTLAVGQHALTGEYGGADDFAPSASGDIGLSVAKASTVTTVTAAPGDPVFGQVVTLTAVVAPVAPGAGTPTGTVTFLDGAAPLGTVALASGRAVLPVATLAAGSHVLTAAYSGDANFSGSTSPPPAPLVVAPASTATVLVSSLNPSVYGQAVTFTATVAVVSPGAGMPTGSVTFKDGGVVIGTATLASGQASVTTSSLGAGAPHAITAEYLGTGSFRGSSTASPLAQVVSPAATETTLASSGGSSTAGDTVTFVATVTRAMPGPGTPTGTVSFYEGQVKLGEAPLDGSATAAFSTADLSVGFHVITAVYEGSTNFLSSSSTATTLAQTVISRPVVISTNRTGANALVLDCRRQRITVTGASFLPPTTSPPDFTVSLGGTGITVHAVGYTSPTEVWAEVSVETGAATSPRTVTVVNPDGGAGTSATAIVDVGSSQACPGGALAPKSTASATITPPSISMTPGAGLLGSTVSITGTSLGATAADNAVMFAGPSGTRIRAGITACCAPIVATVPTTAVDGAVTVTVAGLASNVVTFTTTTPTLTGVSPATVTPDPVVPVSASLTLTGAKFAPGATVTFGPATGISVSSATVAADGTSIAVAISLAPGAAPGSRDVTVTNPNPGGAGIASSTLAGGLTVKPAASAILDLSLSGLVTASYLPSVGAVSVTLNASGVCTAKSVTPTAVPIRAQFASSVTGPPTNVTFTLSSSSLPGTAGNEDCELPLGGPASSDFSFSATDATAQQVTVPATAAGGSAYETTLYSWDFGGRVTVTVTGVAANGTTVTGTLTLPVDTDGDNLPDVFEAQNGLNALNPDEDANGVPDGDDRFARDGLSNFEKYRGVYLAGPVKGSAGALAGHVRLAPGARHLFVRGRGFADDPAVQASPGTCGINPTTGVPVADATLSASNPCPAFEVGPAFASVAVQVHNVSGSFSVARELPRRSLVDGTTATLDMATVSYDGVACYGAENCDFTSKIGARNWEFPTLGFSTFGGPTTYGSDARVFKRSVEAYFNNRPYQHRTNSATAIVVAPDGTPMLAPLTLVGDTNDNGIRDTNKEAVDAANNLLGDTYIAGSFLRQLSAMAVTNDGCVQLPLVTDPRTVARCTDPGAASGPVPAQATKRQVVRSVTTHELAHAVGVNLHTTDATDLMYQYSINWLRDGHFSPTSAALIQIHNRGQQ